MIAPGIAIGAALAALVTGSGPGEAAFRQRAATPRADFRVLVWYSKTDPLGSFQYQIYDLRKHEDSPAIDRWLSELAAHYPNYVAISRRVDLTSEKGETEALKVGSVVLRELTVAAGMAGVPMGGSLDGRLRIPQTPAPGAASRASRTFNRPSPIDLGPSAPSFPVPMPYPRPHP
jgi:hypothetical protein